MDNRTIIYDRIYKSVKAVSPDCYVAQVREIAPKQIPCAFITQISKARVMQYATLANTDEQARLGFESEIYAKNIAEAHTLMEAVEDEFKALGFFQLSCDPLESGDPSIYRLVARFTGVTGSTIGEQL